MKICKTIASLSRERKKIGEKSVGIVPTMGFLHDGHLSLIRKSKKENEVTVVSIFVNPTQFGPAEDFSRYPRDTGHDIDLLNKEKVDILFAPEAVEMYPESYATYVEAEKLSHVLCGQSRPGHFRGVATVVLKLFHIVQPSSAYFGQKDAQQAVIIKRMVRDLSLEHLIRIRVVPTVRDRDGLALSSRNAYLAPGERKAALVLPRSLNKAEDLIRQGESSPGKIAAAIRRELAGKDSVVIEYVAIVALDSLAIVKKIDPRNTLVAVAVRIGRTRLIDNFISGEFTC